MYHRILIVDDGSDAGMDAIAFGHKLAELGGGEIRTVPAGQTGLQRADEQWRADVVVVLPRRGEAGEVLDGETAAVIVAPAGYRNVFARRQPAILVS
jgi:nucleotide-binding universal stress UspA family protein